MDKSDKISYDTFFKPAILRLFKKNQISIIVIILFHLALISIERILALISLWLITMLIILPTGKILIGLNKPQNRSWYLISTILGFSMVGLSAILCWALLGWQENNLFVDMARAVSTGFHLLGENAPISARIALLLFAWMTGPFLEELLFRGYTQSLLSHYLGIWPAIILQAVLFAIIHPLSSLSWFVVIFAAGLLYGWIRQKSQSIWPAILAHAAYNIGILIISFTFLPNLI